MEGVIEYINFKHEVTDSLQNAALATDVAYWLLERFDGSNFGIRALQHAVNEALIDYRNSWYYQDCGLGMEEFAEGVSKARLDGENHLDYIVIETRDVELLYYLDYHPEYGGSVTGECFTKRSKRGRQKWEGAIGE